MRTVHDPSHDVETHAAERVAAPVILMKILHL